METLNVGDKLMALSPRGPAYSAVYTVESVSKGGVATLNNGAKVRVKTDTIQTVPFSYTTFRWVLMTPEKLAERSEEIAVLKLRERVRQMPIESFTKAQLQAILAVAEAP